MTQDFGILVEILDPLAKMIRLGASIRGLEYKRKSCWCARWRTMGKTYEFWSKILTTSFFQMSFFQFENKGESMKNSEQQCKTMPKTNDKRLLERAAAKKKKTSQNH